MKPEPYGKVIKTALISAVSTVAIMAATAGATVADEVERIDKLEQQIDELQKELKDVRDQVGEAEDQPATDGRVLGPRDARVLGPREMKSGKDEVRLTISGQVNRGVLVADDGDDTDVFFVDNDNSSTRIRLLGDAKFNDDISVGSVIEVQFESNSTAEVSQDNQRNVGANSFTERKLEVFVNSETYGRLWLGQGDTASNGTSEVDLSGTAVIGYSGIADFAGGLQFQEDGVLSGTDIGYTFSNLDGLSRDDRLRYDTPVFKGAKLSTSVIADDRFDVALRYSREILGAHEFEAAIAYADVDDDFARSQARPPSCSAISCRAPTSPSPPAIRIPTTADATMRASSTPRPAICSSRSRSAIRRLPSTITMAMISMRMGTNRIRSVCSPCRTSIASALSFMRASGTMISIVMATILMTSTAFCSARGSSSDA